MQRLQEEYRQSVDALERLFHLYQRGNKETYIPIAVELRKLLCSSRTGDGSLSRLHPEARLHPLFWTKFYRQYPHLTAPSRCFTPGELKLDPSGDASFNLLLDITGERMPVNSWVEQPFIDPEITIEKFIRLVSEYDPESEESKASLNQVKSKSLLLEHPESIHKLVLALAEYILAFVRVASLHNSTNPCSD